MTKHKTKQKLFILHGIIPEHVEYVISQSENKIKIKAGLLILNKVIKLRKKRRLINKRSKQS